MELNATPTEQTMAATDRILVLAALAGGWYLRRGTGKRWRELLWSGEDGRGRASAAQALMAAISPTALTAARMSS